MYHFILLYRAKKIWNEEYKKGHLTRANEPTVSAKKQLKLAEKAFGRKRKRDEEDTEFEAQVLEAYLVLHELNVATLAKSKQFLFTDISRNPN